MNSLSYDDKISLISFLSKINNCIDISFDQSKNNCNSRVVELFDNDVETKYKICCIPLKLLEEIYIKYINNELPKIKSDRVEYKKKIFETLIEKKIFEKNKQSIFKIIKYYYKIVLNKQSFFWKNDSVPIIDSFDKKIKNENYHKFLNFCKENNNLKNKINNNQAILYALSDHEIINILANILKFKICAYSDVFMPPQNKYYSGFYVSNFLNKHLRKFNTVNESYIPILINYHWSIIYINKVEKYIIYYNSLGNENLGKLSNKTLVYKNMEGFVLADNIVNTSLVYDIINHLSDVLCINHIFINGFKNQYLDHTCGFFLLTFVYLNESYDKKLINVKKLFNTLYFINDNLANAILKELVVDRLDLKTFEIKLNS